jgi:putative serine protease PepD
MNDSPTPQSRKHVPRTIAALAVVAAVGAGTGVGAYALVDSSSTPAPAASAPLVSGTVQPAALLKSSSSSSLVSLYKRTSPGVVDIVVTTGGSTNSNSYFGGPQSGKAEGTGFVLDSKGDIVTNQHVVSGASAITVKFQNGKSAKATLVGSDSGTDLAVIKVDPSATTLVPLTLGDSSTVQTGQAVFAIGSPFGLPDSLTAGIVSATGRTITSPSNKSIANAIQTDAAINHGNSGGPLLDESGNVIGVNSQIESQSGGSDGVGFAIPVNTVKSVTSQLVAGQKVTHPFLGVYLADASGGGATISKLTTGGPADTAGIQVGDVITAVDSSPVTSSSDLVTAISADNVGQKVTLTVTRGGASQQIAVTLGVTSS